MAPVARVQPCKTAFCYTLVREIETRLGRPAAAKYGLALTVTTSEEGLAIETADNTRRYNLIGKADFALRELGTGQIVSSGNVETLRAIPRPGPPSRP